MTIEMVPCPFALAAKDTPSSHVFCYLCANGDSSAPGTIPAAMAVEFALIAPTSYLLTQGYIDLRKNHGLTEYQVDDHLERNARDYGDRPVGGW